MATYRLMRMTLRFSFADKESLVVQDTLNSDLSYVDKYQAMVMGYKKVNLEFRCKNTNIPNSNMLEMLGITVDDMLKFDIQVANICGKVPQQVAVLKVYEKYTSLRYKKEYLHVIYCSSF